MRIKQILNQHKLVLQGCRTKIKCRVKCKIISLKFSIMQNNHMNTSYYGQNYPVCHFSAGWQDLGCLSQSHAMHVQLTCRRRHKLILLTNCYIGLGCVARVALHFTTLRRASQVALVCENQTCELNIRTSLWKSPLKFPWQLVGQAKCWIQLTSVATSLYSTQHSSTFLRPISIVSTSIARLSLIMINFITIFIWVTIWIIFFLWNHVDNKRLDEWVTVDRLNVDKLQMPKKDKTPVKDGKSSRASTPERDLVRGNMTDVLPNKPNKVRRHPVGICKKHHYLLQMTLVVALSCTLI